MSRRFFFRGGVRVRMEGYDRERFLNIAAKRQLTVCEIAEKAGQVSFWTTPGDFKRMKPVARKAKVRLRIRERYGLPFFLHRNRKRKLLAAGLCSFFMLLYALSFFIWDISFEGNRKFTDEMLLHYMETLPVVCGMRKSALSCEALEGELRNHFTEITWVSAEIRGTRLIIRLKENEALLAVLPKENGACDLVAEKEGVIVRTVVRSGIPQVKAGDTVAAGDQLVSGTIPIFDDSETLVNTHAVRGDGEIYARTTCSREETLPLCRTIRGQTGRKRWGISIQVFGRSLCFLMPDFQKKNPWEFVTEQRQLTLFRDFCLPVYGSLITAREYVPYEKACTRAEAEETARRHRDEYMEKLTEKGIQIIGNNDRIEKDASGWKIRFTVTVIEDIAAEAPIGEQQDIPEKQEENQTVNERN